jgi:hypothetical protein
MRFIGLVARVRLESTAAPVGGAGALHRRGDHRPMAEMDPVEIANGDGRADQPIEAGTVIADNDEGWAVLGSGMVGP